MIANSFLPLILGGWNWAYYFKLFQYKKLLFFPIEIIPLFLIFFLFHLEMVKISSEYSQGWEVQEVI